MYFDNYLVGQKYLWNKKNNNSYSYITFTINEADSRTGGMTWTSVNSSNRKLSIAKSFQTSQFLSSYLIK